MARAPEPDQLDAILNVVSDVLGRDVVGAYFHGSAVLGGLRPRSDVDVLVVSRRRTAHEEKQLLVDRLLAISGSTSLRSRRPVELTIVVESEIKPWRYPPSFDFQYGEWLRSEFESGNVGPWPTTANPDVATLATGDIRSKDDAAAWALERLPEEHRAVLARARAIYRGDEEERWDDIRPRVRPHADYVFGEIERIVAGASRP